MPGWLPAFNKRVTNPIQELWAPFLPPYAVIHHVGRRTGEPRHTPVIAFRQGSHLFVNLLYGSDSQWVRNVLAAGSAEAVRRGRRIKLTEPLVVTPESAPFDLPIGVRLFGRSTGVLVMTIA
jgi:deazaflavin-dependent oxidoreductase (nitroreductase family)